ncbi:MAG: ShlB/FhaC/HecB family hemolysin secretion/activation protein [Nitrospirales bacterium]|nr:ShlB/FhaC/HecB family hemolysin secretion/activation protein [Nitrospirales bacterium]
MTISYLSPNRLWHIGIIGVGLLNFLLICLHPSLGLGQSPPSVPPPNVLDPTGRSGEPPPLQKQGPLPFPPSPRLILPPVNTFPELEQKRAPLLRVMVKKIHIEGSTVFTPEELAKVTAPFENRELSTEDLEELRRALTLLYVNKGYVNSGAIIPDQAVQEGEVTIRIIEGKLTDIKIEGTKYFLPFYLEDRIALDAGLPFNIRPLKERLQILLQDPRIVRLNTELKPGLKPGEAILQARVEEASPFRAWTEFNNYQSPTVGAERGLGTIAVDNVLGIGDQFLFTYGQSKGVNPLIATSYIVPFTPRNTTLELQYRLNNFAVVSAPFKQLDITSKSQIFKITIRHPLYRTLTDEVAISLIGEHLQNQTFLGGTGFAFTPGTSQDGKSIVSAIRFAQEWIHREPMQVLSFRSRFSVGLDVLDATNNQQNSDDADSQFFAWLGQAQWVRRFDPTGIELLISLALQISNDSLFPLEQFAVGGRYSVRGYRENQLVRDNAFLFSVETQIPVMPALFGPYVSVHFAPFIDVGRSWNAKFPTPDPQTLASIGAGIRLGFFNRAFANVYWGQQLNHIDEPPPYNTLQNNGLHVQFVMNIL